MSNKPALGKGYWITFWLLLPLLLSLSFGLYRKQRMDELTHATLASATLMSIAAAWGFLKERKLSAAPVQTCDCATRRIRTLCLGSLVLAILTIFPGNTILRVYAMASRRQEMARRELNMRRLAEGLVRWMAETKSLPNVRGDALVDRLLKKGHIPYPAAYPDFEIDLAAAKNVPVAAMQESDPWIWEKEPFDDGHDGESRLVAFTDGRVRYIMEVEFQDMLAKRKH